MTERGNNQIGSLVNDASSSTMLMSTSHGWNMLFDMFLSNDYTVRELKQFVAEFNEAEGTNLDVGSQENIDAVVKGSYVLGLRLVGLLSEPTW